MALTWKEQLATALQHEYGKTKAPILTSKYDTAFPMSYRDETPIAMAIQDIKAIEELSNEQPLTLHLYYQTEPSEFPLHIRVYQIHKPIPLSDILPMLENLNLKAYSEITYDIPLGEHTVWISDFSTHYHQGALDLDTIKPLFADAFAQIYAGQTENDGFNKLILGAGITVREVTILRAYAKYLHQVGFRFSQQYIEKALATHPAMTKALVQLFTTLHHPDTKQAAHKAAEIKTTIQSLLENVSSLDEDRILKRIFDLIMATLRTNYFQTNALGKPKEYVSFKFASKDIPELPLPLPLFEIFVYSPRFEGIHLRSAKIARGGIRWSDRREDFRTEILGLMKAQKVKNAVIVPSGAKGGFVLKQLPTQASREMIQNEVVFCYQSFIRGLLDLTDNIRHKKIVPPKHTVCYDEPDPYLVVAADKGTATFSDLANRLALEYEFWLGDAFASGGSKGYDHKKMGITARGAWESIKRHFRELNIDATTAEITTIGIGDMSGDVFGNGMLYTKHLRLVAAFDHRHIFIDPNPNPEAAYQERLRLFHLPTSSWEDYNPSLISTGGGVFKRSLKSISLTPEMQKILGTEQKSLTPTELIRVILTAPVDLFFNGGIGTYVKASTETAADVGDRTNDYCRVDGRDLRCKVVGEGGNLGFTQRGRVEYALHGGLINTDFIDNSAGVDCSDHEVNLKILLDEEVNRGNMTEEARNQLLASLTDEVASLVLHDNYSQALVMSFSAHHAKKNIGLHQAYIRDLEAQGILNRQVECLPDDKTLSERKAAELGLTRPELAVLLAYTKIYLKAEILQTTLTEDPFYSEMVVTAFPPAIRDQYKKAMRDHRLRKEIIATQLSNDIVNQMGITYVYRIQIETGASIAEIIRAFTVSSQSFATKELQSSIEALDFKLSSDDQFEMLFHIRHLINLGTRWFLRTAYLQDNISETVKHFAPRINSLEDIVPNLMAGSTQRYLEELTQKFDRMNLPNHLARRIGAYRALYTSLNIIDIATKHHFDLVKTARVYFAAGERAHLLWFRDQIANDSRDGHWNTLARLALRNELDICQRSITIDIMNHDQKEKNTDTLLSLWENSNAVLLKRWENILNMVHTSNQVDYTMFFIAIRELTGLIVK